MTLDAVQQKLLLIGGKNNGKFLADFWLIEPLRSDRCKALAVQLEPKGTETYSAR